MITLAKTEWTEAVAGQEPATAFIRCPIHRGWFAFDGVIPADRHIGEVTCTHIKLEPFLEGDSAPESAIVRQVETRDEHNEPLTYLEYKKVPCGWTEDVTLEEHTPDEPAEGGTIAVDVHEQVNATTKFG